MSAASTYRVFRPDPRSLDRRERCHRGTFCASHLRDSTVVITVEGEVDATNSRLLASYVERQVTGSARLVLDLRLVEFFGTAAFAALHNINVISSRNGASWVLRAGRQVRRLLLICDPDGALPLEGPQSVLEKVHAGAGDREFLVGGNN